MRGKGQWRGVTGKVQETARDASRGPLRASCGRWSQVDGAEDGTAVLGHGPGRTQTDPVGGSSGESV